MTARARRTSSHGRSEGSRRLLAVVGASRQVDVAARLGIDRTLLTRWGSGQRLPTKAQRDALLAAFSIPIEAWDQSPMAAPALAPEAIPALSQRAFEEQTRNLFDEVQWMRARAKWHREHGDDAMFLRQSREATAAHLLLGRLLGVALEITEERAARLPSVRRLLERVALALRPWPEALRAAHAAIVAAPDGPDDPSSSSDFSMTTRRPL